MPSTNLKEDKSQATVNYHVGFRQANLPYEDNLVPTALWYPTFVEPTTFRVGAFSLSVAKDAPAISGKNACVILSHGSGTSPLSHRLLASRLASRGFIVAAPIHPRDNWRDKSGIGSFAQWGERPIVLSCLLDQLLEGNLGDLEVDRNNVGMYGHSVGGYAVLALLGGAASVEKIITHCTNNADDSAFCNYGGEQAKALALSCPHLPAFKEDRIKCAVVASPIVVPIFAEALQSISVPLLLLRAAEEDFLNNRYHADVLPQTISDAYLRVRSIACATHYSFIEPSEYGSQREGLSPADKAVAKQVRSDVEQVTVEFLSTHLNSP